MSAKTLVGFLSFAIYEVVAGACVADVPLQQRCGDVLAIMSYAEQGVSLKNSVFTLGRSGQGYYLLFLSKVDPSRNSETKGLFSPWRLLERQGETLNYCLIAAGDRIEALKSLQSIPNPQTRYGMPGSSLARCSDGSNVQTAVDLRIWANKELGDSLVFHLTSNIADKNFTFLMSKDNYWILLDEDRRNVAAACFYSRGDQAISHYDMPIAAPK